MIVGWFLVVGALLAIMAFTSEWVERWPVSPALVYLLVGAALAAWTPLLNVDALRDASWIEPLAEIAVLISLFAVGLKLRIPLTLQVWQPALRLASVAMVVAIAGGALAGHFILGLTVPAALVLGAIIAPTDPVLASDVQLRRPGERDSLRVTLSAEGGLNDGTAFPFVMLGLGLLGAHELGHYGMRWIAVDLLWAVGAGIGIGWLGARGIHALARRLRAAERSLPYEEFLSLGAIALVYGAALAVSAYGFLAVFALGLGLGQRERSGHAAETDPSAIRAASGLTARLQQFVGQLERLVEVAIVLIVGALLVTTPPTLGAAGFALAIILAVRPISTSVALLGLNALNSQRRLVAWFGIRGIGSVYYLAYVLNHGVADSIAQSLVQATLATIALSIFVHGISATPLMQSREAPKN
jgi:sodium/hydrogen antiporter